MKIPLSHTKTIRRDNGCDCDACVYGILSFRPEIISILEWAKYSAFKWNISPMNNFYV